MKKMNNALLALLATGAILSFPIPSDGQMYGYATNRGAEARNVQRLNYYSRSGQQARDVRRILGVSPSRVGRDIEEYVVHGSVDYHPRTGIPINAGRRLIVHYGRDGRTRNWYVYP